MDASNFLVYVPPALFAVMAGAFLLLWHLGLANSWQWSAGFAQTGMGFAFSTFPVEPKFDAFASGLIFIGAAYCYASALLVHFGAARWRVGRRIFVAGYCALLVYVVYVLESLRYQLFLTDFGFACLLGFAVCVVIRKAAGTADVVLIVASTVVVLDTLARTFFFTFFRETSDRLADFVGSDYNLAVHITTITICLSFPLAAVTAMASAVIQRHRDAAERDPLTGLFNRRGFEEAVREARQTVGQGALLACDIDHFKRVNDTYGHAAGDHILVELARKIVDVIGLNGHAARFGGEEFVVFLPGASIEMAFATAEAIRTRFTGSNWYSMGIDQQISASFGVATVDAECVSIDAAIHRADEALYAAKAAGRNQVSVEPSQLLLSINLLPTRTISRAPKPSAASSRTG